MSKYATTSWQAREALSERRAYTTHGAMYAIEGVTGTGRLPRDWADEYRADMDHITYTVVSYSTPIAWVLDNGTVVIPDVKYSVTTSKHQGMLYALGATERTRNGIADAAVRERQRERDRQARNREARVRAMDVAVQRATQPGGVAYQAPHRTAAEWAEQFPQDAPTGPLSQEEMDRRRLAREEREQEDATLLITSQAGREDYERSQERPTWEDGWYAPRPYATTDGAIYSDDYLFRRNRP